MPNPNLSELTATTIESRSKKVADNLSNNNALLRVLKQRGNVRTVSGGSKIVQEFMYEENQNAGWYSGYDALPVSANEAVTGATFDLKQMACAISFSGLDMLRNAGPEKMIDIAEQRIMQAERTMRNMLCAGLYSDGTGYSFKEVDGLAAALPLDPTQGTYGNINRADWAMWRPQARDLANANNLLSQMNQLWASLVRDNERVDTIMMDNLIWNEYVGKLQANQRFTNTTTGDAGFQSLKFMDADVVLDGGIGGGMPSGTAYFLNTNYLHYRPHAKRNMRVIGPDRRYSTNQDAETIFLGWAGNLTCSGQKFLGVLDINA